MPIATDSGCADLAAAASRPWVVDYDRSAHPGNFDLAEVYQTHLDVLERYGLVHFPGLARRAYGEAAMAEFDRAATSGTYDMVLGQGPGIGPKLDATKQYDVPAERLEQLVARQSRKLDGLKGWAGEAAMRNYWDIVDARFVVQAQKRAGGAEKSDVSMQADAGVETSEELAQRAAAVPDDFVAWYGMQSRLETISAISRQSAVVRAELLSPGGRPWNMHDEKFGGPRNLLCNVVERPTDLEGIASPYSYVYRGSSYTAFPHHFEDFFLPSVNLLYGGASKLWMGIPASETRMFWNTVRQVARRLGSKPDEKNFIITPRMLRRFGPNAASDPAVVIQEPGDMVVSAAGASHGGFNLGDNLAEAVNFADSAGVDGWLRDYEELCSFYLDERHRSIPNQLDAAVAKCRAGL